MTDKPRSQATLPDWHDLVAAFRGEVGHTPGDPLVARWAQNLAHLHRVRHIIPARATDIDRRRGELVALINTWVATHIHPTGDDADRIGVAVDDLAAAYVDAEFVLATAEHGSDETVHAAWLGTSNLVVGWADLVSEVVYGQPPVPWPLIPIASK
ncbi:DUF4254 domain-containing protein [Nocardia sp. 2YAB30]|uniref:DUF4254 domain-containing protein n=1 Tax=unclassified Nocardia TaxID=2637762 RepID=UPI003F976FDB